MYTPPKYQPDRAAALAVAEARGFGAVYAWLGGKPVASARPFCLEHSGENMPRAVFHAARGNAAKFESWLAPRPPWTTSEVSSERRGAMMQAIAGLVMAVNGVEGSFKQNQHKSDVDQVAASSAVAQQSEPAAQQLARMMRAMRPQAFAAGAAQPNEAATPEGSL